jgi:hypothetical protein
VDASLPNNAKFWLNNATPVAASLFVIAYTTPLFLGSIS